MALKAHSSGSCQFAELDLLVLPLNFQSGVRFELLFDLAVQPPLCARMQQVTFGSTVVVERVQRRIKECKEW